MKNIEIKNATKEYKDYILNVNTIINNENNVDCKNYFSKNIDKDIFGKEPKAKCLIALIDEKPVGMILYSKCYWADDGNVIWVSQSYVEERYKEDGVFNKLINKLKEDNKDCSLIACTINKDNTRMIKIIEGHGGKGLNTDIYYIALQFK